MRSLEGQVALVTGGGAALGRASALALAARGVRIVVTGREEKALGETVGEIAHAGGKARHLVGDPRDAAHLATAAARALEVFGGLDIVIDAASAASDEAADATLGSAVALLATLRSPGRFVIVGASGAPASDLRLRGRARELAAAGTARKITCNAVLLGGARGADDSETIDDHAMELAELVVLVCASAADRLTGQVLTLDLA